MVATIIVTTLLRATGERNSLVGVKEYPKAVAAMAGVVKGKVLGLVQEANAAAATTTDAASPCLPLPRVAAKGDIVT
jgi:hypothetical protein